MGSYLKAAQDNIRNIVEAIVADGGCEVQFGLVEYRDHPPEDETFAVRVSPFTTAVDVMKSYVDRMEARGGGDCPESVVDGMAAALEMPWRETAAKVVALIADAPPHGLGTSGDGFADGCPCGRDPIEVAQACAKRGICIYTIGAEPGLSNSGRLSLDFMRAVAKITSGMFLPLGSAGLLAKVIVGSALEQVQLRTILEEIAVEVRQLHAERGSEFTKEDAKKYLAQRLKERHVETTQLKVDDIYQGHLRELDSAWLQYSKLTKIRDVLLPKLRVESRAPPKMRLCRAMASSGEAPKTTEAGSSTTLETIASAMSMARRAACVDDDDMGFGELSVDDDEEEEAAAASAAAAPPSVGLLATQSAELGCAEVTEEQVDRMAEMGMQMSLF